MDPQVRVPAVDGQGLTRLQGSQRPLDEDVGTAVDSEVLKVDSRAQR
jgi:hypothetical protein